MKKITIKPEDFKDLKFDVNVKVTPWYTRQYCEEMNRTDPRVHYDEYCCEWVAPYGFVPEAGCPKHDV